MPGIKILTEKLQKKLQINEMKVNKQIFNGIISLL